MVDRQQHTWRLSKIQEELENVEFPPPPPPISSTQTHDYTHSLDRLRTSPKREVSPSGPHGGSLRRRTDPVYRVDQHQQQQQQQQQQGQIYDKVVIKPAYHRKSSLEDAAVKKITEKYDSLGRNGMGLLKAYAESLEQQQRQQQHQRSRSYDSMLDSTSAKEDFRGPALNSDLLVTGAYRRDTVNTGIPASVGADPSFPPPPTQDELTNASGIVTRSSAASLGIPPMLHRVPAPGASVTAPKALRLEEKGGLLTEAEVLQVEMFYRSHKSEVWVSQSTAHLHLGSVKVTTSLTPKLADKKPRHSSSQHNQPRVGSEMVENWKYVKMGVPVFLLDSGDSRRDRKLYILLAEKGTGFTLWRDKMDHLSAYKASTSVFHTMHLSGDHNNMAGFAFDDAHAAAEFLTRWKSFSSNPDDDILNLSGKSSKKRKKEEKKQKGKFKPPNKSAISTPCCFTHVTKLDRTDGMNILGTKGPMSATRDLKQLSSPVKMSRVSSLIPNEPHSN